MRTPNFLLLTIVISLAVPACKESPAPGTTKESAEPARHQAPETLKELIGGEGQPRKGREEASAPSLPPGHPPIPHGSQSALAPDFAKVHTPPSLPAGHPPIPGTAKSVSPAPHNAPTSLPLKPTGSGSQAELARIEKSFSDSGERALFQKAFTSVFHQNRALRNPVGAEKILQDLAKTHPNNPAIYRVLGYAAVDNGFQMARAIRFYERAVELAPDYAEVHYALAFMYAMGDRAKGARHFQQAMDLGIKDERGIGPRFYPTTGK